jgi:DNA-binding NtrC family response regulator
VGFEPGVFREWPGNVRELERLIERVVTLARSTQIELDDLPPQVRGQYRDVLAPALAASDSMRAWASRYAPGVRTMWPEQTAGQPSARYQLSHARCLPPVRQHAFAAAGQAEQCEPLA